MPEINININDQDYNVVCDQGEEQHLKELAAQIDFKVRELTKKFGKVGETRLMVMASLLIADQAKELSKQAQDSIIKIKSLEASLNENEKRTISNQDKSTDYVELTNDKINDLLSKIASIN
ncbi:MAG: cell division protein ZapA [Candidatus Pelagibacterales bacterium]|jgi:cell division protein ZapA|tara:strand:+ start:3072 stop:3434 length:363 start_codon:yes stop_codon:yes gene_type:complete